MTIQINKTDKNLNLFQEQIKNILNYESNRVNHLNETLNKDYIKKPSSNNPCLNGGICSDNGTSYICSCSIEYWGSNCESKI